MYNIFFYTAMALVYMHTQFNALDIHHAMYTSVHVVVISLFYHCTCVYACMYCNSHHIYVIFEKRPKQGHLVTISKRETTFATTHHLLLAIG